MTNWTVLFKTGNADSFGAVDALEYVSADYPQAAIEIATRQVESKDYRWTEFWEIAECAVSPVLAEALGDYWSREYDYKPENIMESLKPNRNLRLGIMYTTLDISDDDGNVLVDDLEIQVYLNYVTGAYEVFTYGDTEKVYTEGYYNDDELAEEIENVSLDEYLYAYGWRVREWWMNHPKELKEAYGATLPEGFEL